MAQYVKFLRGTYEAYQKSSKNSDTLYFVTEQDDINGQLFLGEKRIGGISDLKEFSIGDLKDILLGESVPNDALLVYDSVQEAWVPKTIDERFPVFGAISTALPGLVPGAPEGESHLFLRNDGTWAAVEHPDLKIEHNLTVIENADKTAHATLIATATQGTTPTPGDYIIIKDLIGTSTTNETFYQKTVYIYHGNEWIALDGNYNAENVYFDKDLIINNTAESLSTTGKNLKEVFEAVLDKIDEKIEVDEKIFETNDDNKLTLQGFANAEEGAQIVKGADGKVSWVKPDTTTVGGLQTAVEALENTVKNMYTKEETDSAIVAEVAKAAHLKRKIVENLDDAKAYIKDNDDFEQYIYMVPTGLEFDSDKYDEYIAITVQDEEEETTLRVLEKVGSWEVDLEGYATTTQLNELKNNIGYTPEAEGDTLIKTIEETYAKKSEVSNLTSEIEQTYTKKTDILITSVEPTEFTIENKKLGINTINMQKINGLVESLNDKVKKEEGKSLISNSLITKVENLSDITNVSSDFALVDGTLSFSSTFNNRLDDFDTSISNLKNELNNITSAITWEDIE